MTADSQVSEGPPARCEVEQARRARRLIESAEQEAGDRDLRFILLVGALHVARSIVEHWYTLADVIPPRIDKSGSEASDLAKRLRDEFGMIFGRAPRYDMLTELRGWDYHWGPLRHPETVGENQTYGQGAPLRLSTGPNPNSSISVDINRNVTATGSAKLVGRKNYYQIHAGRFVDAASGEALPLDVALREFLEDLPARVDEIRQIPEVQAYMATL